jgi:type IV secretory pathway VirJ component
MKIPFVLLVLICAMQVSSGAAAEEATGEAGREPRAAPIDVRDLPLTEVPAPAGGDMLALLITGDGGWAPLDQEVSAELARGGIPVVGLSSLEYFWHARTPEFAARDIAEVLHHYLMRWQRGRIMLIGYSRGAQVLPFIVNRLPSDLRARLSSVNLLGLPANAMFEVSAAGWIRLGAAPSMPVAPELARIASVPVLCVYGEGERDSLCPSLTQSNVTPLKVGSGHHFGGDYRTLGQTIAKFSTRPPALPRSPAK